MSKFDLDMKSVRALAELLKETGLTEIEYAEGDRRIRCVSTQSAAGFAPQTVLSSPTPVFVAPAQEEVEIQGTKVTAPMVGTVYRASEPGAAPFIKEGDSVKQGDTLLIIEAMKVMNPIKAPQSGVVQRIMVQDAQPVEFGETLVVIN
ncbi:MAG: acetyl-CoA carboxylase biotin carboxyl carrier protein [Alphaproteobacteria bacterium]|nr:acetyl-CoA carboxylase biotin carboxyl carrier protein [Alphaproteobacteria bacterium]